MSPAGGGQHAIRTCTATTGFFVLERCDRAARTGCARCQRSICNRHELQLPGDSGVVCPECFAAARGFVGDPNDPLWAVGYRRSFYWEVSSITGDTTWWNDFDSFDNEAFALSAADGDWAEGGFDDGGDYLDS